MNHRRLQNPHTQLARPILGARTVPAASMVVLMVMLIVAENGGFTLILTGSLIAR